LWESLYESYYKELIAFGIHLSGSKELTEDLVQETFIKALTNTDTLEDLSPGKQRAWLYRTFKNLFFDRCRRAALETAYQQNLETQPEEDPALQRVETQALLQTMAPQDQAIFQLRYFEGYTSKEIAEMLHLPAATVRSRLARCRNHLKEQL
jgi:RNA polymerase sigma-70 factor (ECF subfamily)